MTQLELAKAIGCHDSTLRRMSPRKRQQWQALAAKGRSIAWFDVLAQLMFEVEAFNACDKKGGNMTFSVCKNVVTLHQFDLDVECVKSFWISDTNQLTEALQYVQGLNK